jgi:hypothetical protein
MYLFCPNSQTSAGVKLRKMLPNVNWQPYISRVLPELAFQLSQAMFPLRL